MFPDLTDPRVWRMFGISAAKVIVIALAFELLVLVVNRALSRALRPALVADGDRDPAWRVKRRERLRGVTRALVRTAIYTPGLLVVLEVFKAPTANWTLPLYVCLGVFAAIALAVGRGPLGDLAAGFSLLLEDALAPGDRIQLPAGRAGGELTVQVEALGWRTVRLRDDAGRVHCLCNRRLREFAVAASNRPAQKPVASADPLTRSRDAAPRPAAATRRPPEKGRGQ